MGSPGVTVARPGPTMPNAVPCPFLVWIYETVPAWRWGRSYEIRVHGFGKPTLAEATARAERELGWLSSLNGRTHRAEFRLYCDRCRGTGAKAGTSRKPCESCGGEGSTEISATVAAAVAGNGS